MDKTKKPVYMNCLSSAVINKNNLQHCFVFWSHILVRITMHSKSTEKSLFLKQNLILS